jgi:hypothetical protein
MEGILDAMGYSESDEERFLKGAGTRFAEGISESHAHGVPVRRGTQENRVASDASL